MARLPRYLLPPEGVYHVTTRGVDGVAVYRDARDRLSFLELLADVVRRYQWDCYALCLMTTHYHLVVETTLARLSAGHQRLNGVYAQDHFNRRHARRGHLWGDRFWSEVVDSDEHLRAACAYVIANPVRAGLCAHPADWRWSGCRFGFAAA
ncbi:MAG: transposase [Actinomycetota bacterium]|nr:transposase [Actinomycetota bacterium]